MKRIIVIMMCLMPFMVDAQTDTTIWSDQLINARLLVEDSIKGREGFYEWDGSAWVKVGSGNTLDQAYNQGGAGLGRVINADAGAVEIVGDGLDVAGVLSVNDGDTSILTVGVAVDTLLGSLPLAWNGVTGRKRHGDWLYAIGAAATNLDNEVRSGMSAINLVTGDMRSLYVNNTSGSITYYNLLTDAINGISVKDRGVLIELANSSSSVFEIADSLNQTIFKVAQSGQVTIKDGSQTAGAFLVSDANGAASWVDIGQTALTAQNDTTGLATELTGTSPITYATIDRLMERVRELELKLTAAGILEE